MIQQASQHEQNIFISHSHSEQSREWVQEFARSLKKQGAHVWLDDIDLRPGEPIQGPLESALRDSDLFVFVVTPDSIKRPNVMFELGAAVGARKSLVAVVPEEFDVSLLPDPLRIRQLLAQSSPDETASRLMSALSNTGNEA